MGQQDVIILIDCNIFIANSLVDNMRSVCLAMLNNHVSLLEKSGDSFMDLGSPGPDIAVMVANDTFSPCVTNQHQCIEKVLP